MNKLEWVVWAVGCVALLMGLLLVRSGRVMGRAALLFCICAAAGLSITCFTTFSKFHLLWILPVSLAVSGALGAWLGARMMRSGLKQAFANPEFRDAMKKAMEQEAKEPDDSNAG